MIENSQRLKSQQQLQNLPAQVEFQSPSFACRWQGRLCNRCCGYRGACPWGTSRRGLELSFICDCPALGPPWRPGRYRRCYCAIWRKNLHPHLVSRKLAWRAACNLARLRFIHSLPNQDRARRCTITAFNLQRQTAEIIVSRLNSRKIETFDDHHAGLQ